MSDLTSPFVLREGDDLIAFDSLENLESAIEAYDVGKLEFFDANGRPLVATVDGYRVHLHADPEATLEPERLEAMLRSYFAGLGARQQRFARYTNAAEHVTSLQACFSCGSNYRASRVFLCGLDFASGWAHEMSRKNEFTITPRRERIALRWLSGQGQR